MTHTTEHRVLVFGNLPSYLWKKKVLTRTPRDDSFSDSSPSSDGDSGLDGNPDRSYGDRGGVGPRIHGFPYRRGVVDGELPRPDEPVGPSEGPAGGRSDAAATSAPYLQKQKQQKEQDSSFRKSGLGVFPKAIDDNKSPRSKETFVRSSLPDSATKCQPLARESKPYPTTALTLPELSGTSKEATNPIIPRSLDVAEGMPFEDQLPNRVDQPGFLALDPMLTEVDISNIDLPLPAVLHQVGQPCFSASDPMPNEMANSNTAMSLPVASPQPARAFEKDGAADDAHGMVQSEGAPPMAELEPTVTEPIPEGEPEPEANTTFAQELPAKSAEEPPTLSTGQPQSTHGLEKDENMGHLPAQETETTQNSERCIQEFVTAIAHQVQTPLAPKLVWILQRKHQAVQEQSAKHPPQMVTHPKRSRRIAKKTLFQVRPAKRVEVVLMRQFSLLGKTEPVTEAARQAYENFFNSELCESNMEAVKELFPSLVAASPVQG